MRVFYTHNAEGSFIMIQDCVARRRDLAKRLPPQSLAIIPAGKLVIRNGDADYRFRQQSDFYYLTGFQEPDAILVVISDPIQSILFLRPRCPSEEQWQGQRLGVEAACTALGVDQAYAIEEFATQLPQLCLNKQAIAYAVGQDAAWDNSVIHAVQQSKMHLRAGHTVPESFWDLSPILGELRLIKSAVEIQCMREAARITVAAHQRAMRACRHLQYEYELEAELIYEFTRQGSRAPAYDSIVASGQHACTLHYTANDGPLTSGDLVLVDAGAEYACYAADVTRTFPVSGQYTAEQRAIYDLVLAAQQAGIAVVKPGVAWDQIQMTMVTILTQGLVDLHILDGHVPDLIAMQAYKPFYMHNSGHWLGLDVHDCGRYRQEGVWRKLVSGMALTVEPGLYISQNMPNVDPRWWGIGVRIEDDIVVTEQGHENLTGALQVTADEIEAFLRE